MPDNQGKKQGNNTAFKEAQWKKGESGNPKGRPKKELTIPHILREILNEEIDGKTRSEIIMQRVVQKAYDGDSWAVQFIADRTEGKPSQHLQVETSKPIKVFDIDL